MRVQLDPTSEGNVLGLWANVASAPDVAFSAPPGPDEDDEVTWEVTLPTDPVETRSALVSAHADLVATRRALGEVPAQVAAWVADPRLLEAEVAFGADAGIAVPSDATEASISIDRMIRAAAPIAWVETRIDDRLVARARTTLGGATSTVVLDTAPQHLTGHVEALALATQSRLAALETVATVLRAALAVTLRLGLPGGPLLALPLVWRLVRRLVDTIPTTR